MVRASARSRCLAAEITLGGPDRALGGGLFDGDGLLVSAEVPAVGAQGSVAQLGDGVHAVEQLTVVAHDHQRSPPVVDDLGQTVPTPTVEVVGGLVQEQDVGSGQQAPGQSEERALATGETVDGPVESDGAEAQPVEDGDGALLDVPVVADHLEVTGVRVTGLDGVQRGPCVVDAEQLVDPGAAPERQILGEVPQSTPDADRSAAGSELAGHEAQERRLAGAVGPDQAGAPGAEGGVEVVEHDGGVGPRERQVRTGDGSRHRPAHGNGAGQRSPRRFASSWPAGRADHDAARRGTAATTGPRCRACSRPWCSPSRRRAPSPGWPGRRR